jgi:hypothetical protein
VSRAAASLAGVKVRTEQLVYPCGIIVRGSLIVGQGGIPPRPGNAKTGSAKTSRVGNDAALCTFIDEVTKEFDGR